MSQQPTAHLAKNIEDFHFGGNWTDVNLRASLEGLDWQDVQKKIGSLHTIAELVYHIHYFIAVAKRVLEGRPLEGKDAESFDVPVFRSQQDWDLFLDQVWVDGREFARLIRQLPDDRLNDYFTDQKYGTYQRNLFGILEHSHYHLGQIVLLKKLIQRGGQK
jgi:hypothetical protein